MGESPAGGPAGEAAQRPGVRVSQHGGLRIPGQRKIGGFGTFWNLWHFLGPFWGSEKHLWQHLQQTGPWYPLIGVCKLARSFYTKSLVFGICLGALHRRGTHLFLVYDLRLYDQSLIHHSATDAVDTGLKDKKKQRSCERSPGARNHCSYVPTLTYQCRSKHQTFGGKCVPSARHFSFFHGSFGISDSKIVWTCLLASSIFFPIVYYISGHSSHRNIQWQGSKVQTVRVAAGRLEGKRMK